MDKLKHGADFVSSNVKSAGTTAKLKTKHIGDNLTGNIHHLGTNIKQFGQTYTEKLHYHQYSIDEDLINRCQDNLIQLYKGLKFVKSRILNLSNQYIKLLQVNENIIIQLSLLIGKDSLNFKGIDDYYTYFDHTITTEIHPKEKNYLIDSINTQLSDYYATIQNIKQLNDWKLYSEDIINQINQAIHYIKSGLKLIKKWYNKKLKLDKLNRKIDKSENNQSELQLQLSDFNDNFDKINLKTKSTLPHLLNFIDEFIDLISKSLFLKQSETFELLSNNFSAYLIHNGINNNQIWENINDWENKIIQDWEIAFMPTKIKIESFLLKVSDDVDDIDRKKLTDKVVGKLNKITSKQFHYKGDISAFESDLTADSLVSFEKYFDYSLNLSETYHPRKKVDEIILSQPHINPPPLPPRSNIVELPKMSIIPINQGSFSSTNQDSFSSTNQDSFSSISINYSSSDSDVTSDADLDISSVSSSDTLQTQDILRNSTKDYIEKELIKIYNKGKNEIKIAPITSEINQIQNKFEQPTTITKTLNELNKLFTLVNEPIKVVKVNSDFDGIEVGDLSFNKGDMIEILLDFQSIGALYDANGKNWVIGRIKTKEGYRVGFVGKNYLEEN